VEFQPPVASNMQMLFQFEDVTKTYGAVTALNNLTLSVPEGAVGLLGPNGSGKTTMIRSLLGLIPVDKGSGEILGMDFKRRQLDIRRAVGFVPEDECLFPRTVGVEFVGYAGELVGMSAKDALQRATNPAQDLPPRLSQTLSELLAGRSEKEVAARLDLSRHTIHNYVKALHQRFEVSSRGELLAKAGAANKPDFTPKLSIKLPRKDEAMVQEDE